MNRFEHPALAQDAGPPRGRDLRMTSLVDSPGLQLEVHTGLGANGGPTRA
jgi:hypothetical protein